MLVSTKPQFKPKVVGIAIILSLIFFSFNFEPRLRHLTLVIYRFWTMSRRTRWWPVYVGCTYNIIQNDIDEIVCFVCLDSVATRLSVYCSSSLLKTNCRKTDLPTCKLNYRLIVNKQNKRIHKCNFGYIHTTLYNRDKYQIPIKFKPRVIQQSTSTKSLSRAKCQCFCFVSTIPESRGRYE